MDQENQENQDNKDNQEEKMKIKGILDDATVEEIRDINITLSLSAKHKEMLRVLGAGKYRLGGMKGKLSHTTKLVIEDAFRDYCAEKGLPL